MLDEIIDFKKSNFLKITKKHNKLKGLKDVNQMDMINSDNNNLLNSNNSQFIIQINEIINSEVVIKTPKKKYLNTNV